MRPAVPRPASSWIRGWGRLGVVLYALVWIVAAPWWLRQADTSRALVLRHVSADRGWPFPLSADDWCAIVAEDRFLALPPDARRREAARVFDHAVERSLRDAYYRVEPLRADFLRSAVLTLEEAPIRVWRDPPAPPRAYRDLTRQIVPRLDVIPFVRDVTLIAGMLLVALLVPAFVVASAIRWIVRGFRDRPVPSR